MRGITSTPVKSFRTDVDALISLYIDLYVVAFGCFDGSTSPASFCRCCFRR